MAVIVRNPRTGRVNTLLSPKEKGKKYASELRTGASLTNDGEFKRNKDGSYRGLTKVQRAYRGGYLDARKDIGKARQHRIKKFKK